MGGWGLALTLGSLALDLFGEKKETEAVQEAAYQNRETMELNQALMEQNKAAMELNAEAMEKEAEYQEWRTGVQMESLKRYRDKVLARQHVLYAKAGISIDSETVQAVFDDTYSQYFMDREILKVEGEHGVVRALTGAKSYGMQASSFGLQATSFGRQGAAYEREASNAKTTGYLGMARTLLNVGGYAYDQGWLNFGG